MAETKFAAMLRSVGGIEGIKECLNVGNTAPLLLVIEEAWRSGAEAMRAKALVVVSGGMPRAAGYYDVIANIEITGPDV